MIKEENNSGFPYTLPFELAENKGSKSEGKLDLPIASTEDKIKGKIGHQLTKAIASERLPELFDAPEITKRDMDANEWASVLISDRSMGIDRKGKPVYLQGYQYRIIHALSYALSLQEEAEDIRAKIEAPFKQGSTITRFVDVTSLSKLIFNSSRKRNKEAIIRELFALSHIRQYMVVEYNGHKVRLSVPLLNIGAAIEDLSTEKQDDLDRIEVTFGSVFFVGLKNRYAVLTPKVFDVWRKSGRGTELFSVLLDSLLAAYHGYMIAANEAEKRVKNECKGMGVSIAERDKEVREARRKALTYELNVSTIKNRVTTDYDGNQNMKRKFWADLQNAIGGFKELGLIDEAKVSKGAKGQEKVYFVLSEDYQKPKEAVKSNLLEEVNK